MDFRHWNFEFVSGFAPVELEKGRTLDLSSNISQPNSKQLLPPVEP